MASESHVAMVLDAFLSVLQRFAEEPPTLGVPVPPQYRIQSVVRIGKRTGRPISEDKEIIEGTDVEGAAWLTMHDGTELLLTLTAR